MPPSNSVSYLIAVSAASAAIATLVPVALFQCGRIETIPDPPGAIFDSATITQSPTAHPLGIPDSLLGLGSYGTTLALLLLSRRSALARHALRAKLAADGSLAAFNVVRQIRTFRKICSWCTGTALATAVLVPAALWATRKD